MFAGILGLPETLDNDPPHYGRVFFKIDYYDLALDQGSENPANEGCTHRILTIMLASEY